MALVLHLGTGPAAAQTATLRATLEGRGIPVPSAGIIDLDLAITSHAVEDAPDLFVIAYYALRPEPGHLDDSLRVSAYDKATGSWAHAAFERGNTGSALGIRRSPRHIFIDTHLNPSAGALVVLSRALEPVARLDGWLLRLMPGEIVLYHRNQVHFAPIHPAELWIWSAATGLDTVLYPARPYGAVRSRYVDSLRARYARLGEPWFREHNHPTDPEWFGSRLGDTLVFDEAGTAVAFVMHFGEGNELPADPPPLDVVVTCRGLTTSAPACSETELLVLRRLRPHGTTHQLLQDLMGPTAPAARQGRDPQARSTASPSRSCDSICRRTISA